MKIELREIEERAVRFVVDDTSVGFLNTLRRVLLRDIPKLAIDNVEFHLGVLTDEKGKDYESITPLFDEIIAHRLSMVSIPTDLSLFVHKDQCKCQGAGCPSCELVYTLKKFGPCTVYSGDLIPTTSNQGLIKDDKIPIVQLGAEQGLFITAIARLGTAKEHMKWQVASGVAYKHYPEIKISSKKCDYCNNCAKICPKDVIKIADRKIVLENLEECTLCKSCEEVCKNEAIKVIPNNRKFIFKFETDGALTAKEALEKVLEIVKLKCEIFEKELKRI
jgi:DNA-directed RNA polymerase subunit D